MEEINRVTYKDIDKQLETISVQDEIPLLSYSSLPLEGSM